MNRENSRIRLRISLLFAGAILVASTAAAQAPSIQLEKAPCLPETENGLIRAKLTNETGGATPHLYFRWDEHGAYYYVAMEAAGGGNYWAVPPKPIEENELVEYYVDVVDGMGKSVARSMTQTSPVTEDCRVVLDARQAGMAENLVVGETAPPQIGERVMGFLCDGIISRIGPDGVIRADQICRRCIVAWWENRSVIAPSAGLVTTGILIDKPDPSPARPRP